MSSRPILRVGSQDAGLRLDRWLRNRFPGLTQGRIQKLLRKGNIRVDGAKAKAADRLELEQEIRLPPAWLAGQAPSPQSPPKTKVGPADEGDAEALRAAIVHREDDFMVLNKPPGLAVQSGSGTHRHVDGLLDALRFDNDERPRLVHRLDKDTSGVLVLARHAAAARWLTRAFREKTVRKLYWAVVVGVPQADEGEISLPLTKSSARREKVVSAQASGAPALTRYRVLDRAGSVAALLAMEPLTGRTHQLRVHAAEGLATPILGDGKYGGRAAFLDGEGLARRLHLHARAVRILRPGGGHVDAAAPLPPHVANTFRYLGFVPINGYDSLL